MRNQVILSIVSISASELDNDVPKPPCPSADSSDSQKAPVAALPSESKEPTATLGERTFNCCYPGEGETRCAEPLPCTRRGHGSSGTDLPEFQILRNFLFEVLLREPVFSFLGCHFKTVHGMKDLDRHLRIHTGRYLFVCSKVACWKKNREHKCMMVSPTWKVSASGRNLAGEAGT